MVYLPLDLGISWAWLMAYLKYSVILGLSGRPRDLLENPSSCTFLRFMLSSTGRVRTHDLSSLSSVTRYYNWSSQTQSELGTAY